MINDYCSIYDPIQASQQDTVGTLNQVFKENGKYLCLCHNDCPQEEEN